MLTTFLTQVTSLFDRRFVVAYWAPMFVVLSLATLGGLAIGQGVTGAVKAWSALDPLLQVILALAALIAVTVLALVLQTMTTPLIRLYEGYWPRRLHGLMQRSIAEQQEQRAALQGKTDFRLREAALRGLHRPGAYRQLYLTYPRKEELVRATRLGNVMTAAEEYAYQVYRLDTILWWPRLAPLLPDTLRAQIDAALTPLIALINLSFLFTLLALVGGPWLVVADLLGATLPWWLFVLVFVGGLLLARLCYEAAVSQAGDYGSLLRVAFDLYRHKVLEEMHIARPDNLRTERRLWEALNQWVYRYIPPWESRWPLDPSEFPQADNFYYDTYKKPPKTAEDKPQRIELTVAGSSTLNLRQEEGHD